MPTGGAASATQGSSQAASSATSQARRFLDPASGFVTLHSLGTSRGLAPLSPVGGRNLATLSPGTRVVARRARRQSVTGCYDPRMNRNLVIAGLVLLMAGLFWTRLRALPLFRLPGDIMIDRPGFKFFFPVTTMLLASVVLSIVLWLLRR